MACANEEHENIQAGLKELERQGGGKSQTPLYKLAGVIHGNMALSVASKGPHLNQTCVIILLRIHAWSCADEVAQIGCRWRLG